MRIQEEKTLYEKLKILTDAEPCCDLTVSRTRSADFLVWFS